MILDVSEEELFKDLCKEPVALLKRVIRVFREEYPKEIEKAIIKEFGDAGKPCETLNLIEGYLEKIKEKQL